MTNTKYQPGGYHTITPYLNIKDAPGFIEFAKRVFGAEITERIDGPGGSIMHAEIRIGDSVVMLSEACEQRGPMPSSLYVYVDDMNSVYKRAVEAGAKPEMPPADMFWGDRFGNVTDAWGIQWSIATHVEDVSPDELKKRAEAFAKQMAAGGGPG
ncbi:MAG: VOC family protein [Opitutales bacterium]|nr:VOC family protein [Opitutales bacterium]